MFGAGIAAGIGIGIAIGMSAGAKQARDKLCEFFANRGITLRDQQGKQLAIDDALDQALSSGDSKSRNIGIVLLALGLLVAAGIGAAIYFLVAHQ